MIPSHSAARCSAVPSVAGLHRFGALRLFGVSCGFVRCTALRRSAGKSTHTEPHPKTNLDFSLVKTFLLSVVLLAYPGNQVSRDRGTEAQIILYSRREYKDHFVCISMIYRSLCLRQA